MEAVAPEGQICSLVERTEDAALSRRVRRELEGAKEDLLRKSQRITSRRDRNRQIHDSSARVSHRRRQLTRATLGNAHGCGLEIRGRHARRWNRRFQANKTTQRRGFTQLQALVEETLRAACLLVLSMGCTESSRWLGEFESCVRAKSVRLCERASSSAPPSFYMRS